MKKGQLVITILIIIGLFVLWQFTNKQAPAMVTNFEECIAAGNPAMESYPRQCTHKGETFIENIGNELEKTDIIRLDSPRPNQVIESPLIVTGQARGGWFFEGDFPIILTDWDGLIIAEGFATAKGEWMTSDFIPFEGTITFTVDENAYSNKGTLILQKDNPSDLREHDDALEIPIIFAKPSGDTATSADNAPEGSMHNLPVPEAVSAVRAKVASDLGINEGLVVVLSAHERTWTNGCLNLEDKREMCTQAIVDGYEVTIQAQGKKFTYHTNEDGSFIREKN